MAEDRSSQMSAMAGQFPFDRDRLEYELTVRQEPKQARMCGVGGKADRRPIDPPPIIQLRVLDPSVSSPVRRPTGSSPDSTLTSPTSESSPTSRHGATSTSPTDDQTIVKNSIASPQFSPNFLQNPYYFMFASLAKPDDDAELHWLKDGRTRCTTGSVVSSLYHLKDTEHHNEDAGFFVFPDLSVRTEGSYRLKLSLYEVVGNNVCHCKSIYSAPFYVYTAKKFPGMEESTPLSCSLADQGIKIRIRKDIRVRKRPIQALENPLPLLQDGSSPDQDDDDGVGGDDEARRATRPSGRHDPKRSRFDHSMDDVPLAAGGDMPGRPAQEQTPWPPPHVDSAPGATGSGPPHVIPPPPPPGGEQPNAGTGLPGPSVYDGRGGGGGYHPYDPPQQQQPSSQGHQGYRPTETTQPPPPQHPPAHPQTFPSPPAHPPQYGPPPGQHILPPPPHIAPPPLQHIPPPPPPPPHGAAPPPLSQLIPPPPPPQHSHAPPLSAHIDHIPPPPHAHHSGPALPPPPGQQGYAPYSGGWGPPPPPQQAQVYDPYPHHSQHQPPPAPHHQPHPPPPHLQHQHQPHYGPPPPGSQQMHHGPPPPPPPPSRYDYAGSAYGPPQQQPYGGYYEQLPQHPPPPPPPPTGYGTNSPRLGPPPLPLSGQQGPGSANPGAGGGSGYGGEYAHSRGSPPPGPRAYQQHQHAHHHSYGGGPPPSGAPYHPSSGYYYGYNGPPPQQNDSWGGPPAGGGSGQAPPPPQEFNQWGGSGDAYRGANGARNGVGDPGGFGNGSNVGALGKPGDRIQLAPLRPGHGGSTSPHPLPLSLPGPTPPSSTPGGGGSNEGPGYIMQSSNGGRVGNGGYGSREGDREHEKVGVGREGERGKKNPLSIGSIISEETG